MTSGEPTRFLTPLPGMAARLITATLQRAHGLHNGPLPNLPKQPFAVKLNGLGFTLEFSAAEHGHGQVNVICCKQTELDTIITASPATLALQATNTQPGGRIEIQGDAMLAQRWQQYFAALNPDWEKGFSERLGPVLGYQLSQGLKQLLTVTRTNSQHGSEMLSEYLQEESRLLVTRTEIQHFLDDVDELAERIARLQATQSAP